MLLRVAVMWACVFGTASAFAEELGPEQARAFVVGKLFSYSCFDGTVGTGRIFADGSVVGTIRPRGRGELRFASLPPGTIRVTANSMCAHLAGLPIEPCFRVQKNRLSPVPGLGRRPRLRLLRFLPAQSARPADQRSVMPGKSTTAVAKLRPTEE